MTRQGRPAPRWIRDELRICSVCFVVGSGAVGTLRPGGVGMCLEEPAVLFLLALLLPFYFCVVGGLFDTELIVKVVIRHGQVETCLEFCNYVDLGSRVDVFFFGEAECAPGSVDTDCGEYVGELIVEHVKHILLVGLRDFVLDFLVYCPERLRAFVGRFGGERVSEDEF